MKAFRNSTVKKPVDVFKSCPECGCKELLSALGDVICAECPWDSIAIYADACFDQKNGPLFRRRPEESSSAVLPLTMNLSVTA